MCWDAVERTFVGSGKVALLEIGLHEFCFSKEAGFDYVCFFELFFRSDGVEACV